jgi:transcriptional regulator with XRE-family HTH domain
VSEGEQIHPEVIGDEPSRGSNMTTHGEPEELAALVALLRGLRSWSRTRLSEASGIDKSRISLYELGKVTPSPRTQKRLAAAVGLPPSLLEPVKAFIGRLLETLEAPTLPVPLPVSPPGSDNEWKRAVWEALERIVSQARAELKIKAGQPSPSDPPRPEALWERLKPFPIADRRLLVVGAPEYQDPQLCQLLCAESERATASDASAAQELAELALLVAEHVPGSTLFRSRLQGSAWAFVGNARRVANKLQEADAAFTRLHLLWKADATGGPNFFAEAGLLDLEASLRRAQRRFPEALALHERALAAAKEEETSLILVNEAFTLEQSGDYDRSLEVLEEAAQLVSCEAEPRLAFALRFNQAVNLLHLGRLEEAEPRLVEARELAVRLGNELDLVRVRWLSGRVAAGRGRKEEALAAFDQVRRDFEARGMGYDCALVSLELAVLHLEQGNTHEVKALTEEMKSLFEAQGVHREALAALKLFCDAARKETLTVELARQVAEYLYRAQNDSELRFEG